MIFDDSLTILVLTMAPPTTRKAGSPTKASPLAKKLKGNRPDVMDVDESEVEGRSKKMAAVKSKRSLASELQEEQQETGNKSADAPPSWFIDFEKRLDDRFEALRAPLVAVQSKLMEQDQKISALDFDVNRAFTDIENLRKENAALAEKLDELENRSRRNNLVIFGIPEPENPSPREDCRKTVSEFFKFVGLTDEDMVSIERCHRTPTHRNEASQRGKPRMIHVGFNSYLAKEKARKVAIQKLKSTQYKGGKIFVAEDLSRHVQELRKKKMERFKQLKTEGKKPFFAYPDQIRYRDQRTGQLIVVQD